MAAIVNIQSRRCQSQAALFAWRAQRAQPLASDSVAAAVLTVGQSRNLIDTFRQHSDLIENWKAGSQSPGHF